MGVLLLRYKPTNSQKAVHTYNLFLYYKHYLDLRDSLFPRLWSLHLLLV